MSCIWGFFLVVSQKEIIESPEVSSVSDSESSEQIKITATMLESRTYGRVLLKNQDQNSEYLYILAEPYDVVSEGGSRYSSTTIDMKVGSVYEVSGVIPYPCNDRYEVAEGEGTKCIAWMNLDMAEEVGI